jgi:Na+-transporting methylmalonyl-CoA/oxaloacetate decarboxylase gamma subunit
MLAVVVDGIAALAIILLILLILVLDVISLARVTGRAIKKPATASRPRLGRSR